MGHPPPAASGWMCFAGEVVRKRFGSLSRYATGIMKNVVYGLAMGLVAVSCLAQEVGVPKQFVVLHSARMLDAAGGRIVAPGEVLVEGDRIVAAGAHVDRPAGAEVIDLGDATLMPGMIDAHVHLFLHVGAEDLQTVQESVPEQTLVAAGAAKADLMAGFTAERDMGT